MGRKKPKFLKKRLHQIKVKTYEGKGVSIPVIKERNSDNKGIFISLTDQKVDRDFSTDSYTIEDNFY